MRPPVSHEKQQQRDLVLCYLVINQVFVFAGNHSVHDNDKQKCRKISLLDF